MCHISTSLMSLQTSIFILFAPNWLLVFQLISTVYGCQPPDKPEGGGYQPVQTKYLPGDKVIYFCKERLTRIGKDQRTCQTTGKWSGFTPFCDSPSKVRNPTASSDPSLQVLNTIDRNPNTCFCSRNDTRQTLNVFLDPPAAVHVIRLYLQKGRAHFRLFIVQHVPLRATTLCMNYERDLEANQWVTLECQENDVIANHVSIQGDVAKPNILAVCEVEIYVKEENWCRNPPNLFIPNGQLDVSRDKATLVCAEGYREKEDVRLVCEKGFWTGPNLQCDEILCDSWVGENKTSGDWHILGKVSKLSVGIKRQLLCFPGFQLTGSPDTVTCLSSGKWSTTSAFCEEVLCDSWVENKTVSNGKWHLLGKESKLSVGIKRQLLCNLGFQLTGSSDTVTCLSTGKWSTTSASCKETIPDKKSSLNIVGIAVGCLIVVIILFMLGLTIFLIVKKRGREVVVIYKPKEGVYSPPSLGASTSSSWTEAEYSTVCYDDVYKSNYPTLPNKSQRQRYPMTEATYAQPVDSRESPPTRLVSKPLPTDIAFGTLKSSDIYESP